MLLSIPKDLFRLIEPYLPKALVRRDSHDLPELARGELARLILMQHLSPGQKVPIDEIAENIGGSRTPVREALRLLETDGLVAAVPNRGFIVCRLTPAEAGQLYEARRCVEVFTAPLAFERRNPAFIADLRALHRLYEQVLKGPGDRRRLGMLVDKAFHMRIAEQAGNPALVSMLSNLFDRLILTRPMDGSPVSRTHLAVQEHAAITKAFEGSNAKAAAESLRKNIDNGGAAVVSHLTSAEDFRLAM